MANPVPQFPPDAPSLCEGRYVLVSRIGRGAVGAVYRAYDRKLRVWRAVKVLLTEAAIHDWVRDQFEADAHTLAQLEHPNLLRVYDVGRASDLPYVVMELVHGASLAHWSAKHGPMPPRMACDAILQVTYALCAVHAHGVVHGGVKPGNVLVAPSGSCKLSDFGIVAPPEGSGHAAPEQIDGSPIDARADLYGVGAMLWHLLQGREPSGRGELGGLAAGLQPIVRRCVSLDREERYPTGHDLAAALEAAAAQLPATGPGIPELCLDRSEEEEEIGPLRGGRSFDEIERLIDDARLRPKSPTGAAPQSLPYTMPPDDPQRRRAALLTPPGAPEAVPEWVDPEDAARAAQALAVSSELAAPPPPAADPSAPLPDLPPPPEAPPPEAAPLPPPPEAPAEHKATPAPSPLAPIQPEPKAPAPAEEPEEPPSRLANWILIPLGVVLAGVVCVLLVAVVAMGMNLSAMSDAADAATRSQLQIYRVLDEERRLVDELGRLGADRTLLEQAYVAYLEQDAEPARLEAALSLISAVDQQSKDRIGDENESPERAAVAHQLRQIQAARVAYDGAILRWRRVAEGPVGELLVSVGLAPAPP